MLQTEHLFLAEYIVVYLAAVAVLLKVFYVLNYSEAKKRVVLYF